MNTKQNDMISENYVFPEVFRFENEEQLSECLAPYTAISLMKVMVSKTINKDFSVKVGEPIAIFEFPLDNDNIMFQSISLPYTENLIEEQYDRVMECLIEDEQYEICNSLKNVKYKYDNKINK
jgi:hypothetical protein